MFWPSLWTDAIFLSTINRRNWRTWHRHTWPQCSVSRSLTVDRSWLLSRLGASVSAFGFIPNIDNSDGLETSASSLHWIDSSSAVWACELFGDMVQMSSAWPSMKGSYHPPNISLPRVLIREITLVGLKPKIRQSETWDFMLIQVVHGTRIMRCLHQHESKAHLAWLSILLTVEFRRRYAGGQEKLMHPWSCTHTPMSLCVVKLHAITTALIFRKQTPLIFLNRAIIPFVSSSLRSRISWVWCLAMKLCFVSWWHFLCWSKVQATTRLSTVHGLPEGRQFRPSEAWRGPVTKSYKIEHDTPMSISDQTHLNKNIWIGLFPLNSGSCIHHISTNFTRYVSFDLNNILLVHQFHRKVLQKHCKSWVASDKCHQSIKGDHIPNQKRDAVNVNQEESRYVKTKYAVNFTCHDRPEWSWASIFWAGGLPEPHSVSLRYIVWQVV